MNVENEIISYLKKYGNTRENDLINYGSQNFGVQPNDMKKTLDRMAVKSRIHRIVHNKLKPAEVYVTLEELLLPELAINAEISSREVERILEEAASLANQKKKSNFDNTFR
jgi:hypothetical protein